MCPPLMIIDQPHDFAYVEWPKTVYAWECGGQLIWNAVTAFQVTDHDTRHHDGSRCMPDTHCFTLCELLIIKLLLVLCVPMRPGPGISGVLSGPGTSGILGLNCTAMQTCSTALIQSN